MFIPRQGDRALPPFLVFSASNTGPDLLSWNTVVNHSSKEKPHEISYALASLGC